MRFDPHVNTIYFDLDGVLADFDKFIFHSMGRVFSHMMGPDESDQEMWDFLRTVPHLYYNLDPTPYCFELIEAALSKGKNVEVLTAIPRRNPIPESTWDKVRWVKKQAKYHPYFAEMPVHFGPYSGDKWRHAKRPGDVLVDDRLDNISDWNSKSQGIGILHLHKNHVPTIEAISGLT